MKFPIDRCAGRRLAEWLRDQGHDVAETRSRQPDPGDAAVLRWAAREGRILITIDSDFGRLIHLGGASHSGLIRLPDIPAGPRIALVERILADYRPEEIIGSVITVRGRRIRISRSL